MQRLGICGTERDQSILGQPSSHFHFSQIRDGSLDITLTQFVVHDLIDVSFAVFLSHRLAWYRKHVAMLRGNNRYANIYVRQKLEIVVIDNAGRLSDVASAMKLYDRRSNCDRALPCPFGHGIP